MLGEEAGRRLGHGQGGLAERDDPRRRGGHAGAGQRRMQGRPGCDGADGRVVEIDEQRAGRGRMKPCRSLAR